MAWLDTIKELSFVLQDISCNWICFFKYEKNELFNHSTAIDHSLSESHGHHQVSAHEPMVSCFFAMQPRVDCCETTAERFFSHPAVRAPTPGSFLIPYYSEHAGSAYSQSPFLKLGYSEWFELSGHPDSDTPDIRSSGAIIERILHAVSTGVACRRGEEQHDNIELRATAPHDPEDWQSTESSKSLLNMFERLKSHMRMGNCYLANGTTRISGPARSQLKISLSQFVEQWVSAPSRYGVFVDCGDELPMIVCFSPERFIERSGQFVQAEPIKGTAPVDLTQKHSGALALWKSTKEMCEQKMVTDLLRNDLNKVCDPGTVFVESPYQVRVAGALLQMQSVVRGTLASVAIANSDILLKTLPAGSVTGTPKYAVGQIISEVEKTERGYYTGVFAHCNGEANFDSTILIRGFFADSNKWYAGVGAGITTLSDSKAEVAEFDLKWLSFASRLKIDASSPLNLERASVQLRQTQLLGNMRNHVDSFTQQQIFEEPRRSNAHAAEGHLQSQVSRSAPLFELAGIDELFKLSQLQEQVILFVDHYDSFSDNLIAALRCRGVAVARIFSAPNSQCSPVPPDVGTIESTCMRAALMQKFHAVVFSPGPGVPSDYLFSQALLRSVPNEMPVLGVCLGHQLLLTDSGLKLERVPSTPVHGRGVMLPTLQNSRFLSDASFMGEATFYNSWQVGAGSMSMDNCLWRACGVEAMGVVLCEHRFLPRLAVQFHPESFATQSGRSLLGAFVDLIASYKINSQANVAKELTQTAKVGL